MRYDFRQPVPRASFVTSRSVIRLVVSFRSRWRNNRRHRAGHLFSRYAPRPALFPENCRISQVPMKPLRPAVHSRPARACAPLLLTPAEPVCLTNAAFPVLSTILAHQGLRQCVNFGAQSRGPALAVYASCRCYLRLRKTRLRLVVSLCRSRFRGMGFLRMVSIIVYLPIISPLHGFRLARARYAPASPKS